MKLDDPTFDEVAREDRDRFLLEALRSQIEFMRNSVPFWRERLGKGGTDEFENRRIS